MKTITWFVAPVLLLSCTGADAHPGRPPVPVLDQADVFPVADEAALNRRLMDYYDKSGNALVVVTLNSLEGETIEGYALGLFNEWGIGDAKTDRGVLVLLAPNERQARIEVGCGLEGTVTDGFAAEVMQTKIIPEYKQNHFEAGTLAAVDALIARLDSPAAANDNGPVSSTCKARLGTAG